ALPHAVFAGEDLNDRVAARHAGEHLIGDDGVLPDGVPRELLPARAPDLKRVADGALLGDRPDHHAEARVLIGRANGAVAAARRRVVERARILVQQRQVLFTDGDLGEVAEVLAELIVGAVAVRLPGDDGARVRDQIDLRLEHFFLLGGGARIG